MAGKYRKQQNADEVILLNNKGRIAEAGAANIFILATEDNNQFTFITPPASEGGVMGAMRNFLVDNYPNNLKNKDFQVYKIAIKEQSITPTELNQTEIIFTTNAVQSIQLLKITTQKQIEIIKKWIHEVNRIFQV